MTDETHTLHSCDTAWGKPPPRQDVRAIRKYNKLLTLTANVGEILVFILILAVAMLVLKMVFTGNFENVIFNDGTDLSCFYDGKTGEIVNVR